VSRLTCFRCMPQYFWNTIMPYTLPTYNGNYHSARGQYDLLWPLITLLLLRSCVTLRLWFLESFEFAELKLFNWKSLRKFGPCSLWSAILWSDGVHNAITDTRRGWHWLLWSVCWCTEETQHCAELWTTYLHLWPAGCCTQRW